MLQFTRPPVNDDFDETINDARSNVQDAVGKGDKPSFPEEWKKFKADFSSAQAGRCGYCEMPIIGSQDGDVEHYAPKSVVSELVSQGTEKPNLSNIRGRKFKEIANRGYWWLAYSWDNYLLACAICNRKWKVALFPVLDEETRTLPPDQDKDEKPLLLNPFGKKNPTKHLLFGDLGEVRPRLGSKFGRATIDVCGLDRPSLRTQRIATIEDANQALTELINAVDRNDAEAEERALNDLHRLGRSRDGARFPGVVRSIFENALDMSWSELEDAVG